MFSRIFIDPKVIQTLSIWYREIQRKNYCEYCTHSEMSGYFYVQTPKHLKNTKKLTCVFLHLKNWDSYIKKEFLHFIIFIYAKWCLWLSCILSCLWSTNSRMRITVFSRASATSVKAKDFRRLIDVTLIKMLTDKTVEMLQGTMM